MGVKGLWRLLMPIGRRISIESLEGKILAIDASIWLTQFLKAMRDPDTGSVLPAAHLIGFFRRLCKLRFHGVRPVLVFDGATPEIKLREVKLRRQRRDKLTMSGLDDSSSEAAMQRMAKRILVAELRKRTPKTNIANEGSGSGAYAPGFRLAEEEEASLGQRNKPPLDPSDKNKTQGMKNTQNNGDVLLPSLTAVVKEQPDTFSLHDLELNEDDWKLPPNVEAVNDFDTAVVEVPFSDEAEETDTDAYQYNPSPSNNTGSSNIVFDIDRVSKLSSHDRTQVVEKVLRNQRMASRREFMPVASNPDAYSQAQLRNFLSSTKLKKDIVKMAAIVVGKDEGVGQRMASDTTRRIVFTKDADTKPTNTLSKGTLDVAGRSNDERRKNNSVHRTICNDDDHDDEYKWKKDKTLVTNNMRKKSAGFVFAPTLDAHCFDDESSDDADNDIGGCFLPEILSNNGDSGGGFLSTEVAGKDCDVLNTHDRDGGGFLPPSGLAQHGKNNSPELQGGGGFLTQNNWNGKEGGEESLPSTENLRLGDIDDTSEEDGILVESIPGACCSQELQDEMLARSIQDSEIEVANETSVQNSNDMLQRTQTNGSNCLSSDAAIAHLQGGIHHVTSSNATLTIDLVASHKHETNESEESNDDDVDWEDVNPEPPDAYLCLNNTDNDAAIAAALQRQEESGMSASLLAESNGSTDGSIEWEAGDVAYAAHTMSTESGKGINYSDEVVSMNQKKTVGDGPPEDQMVLNLSADHNKSTHSLASDFSIRPNTDANVKALELAQATAANLTDWAGRAFRRAIAKHVEETGGNIVATTGTTSGKQDDERCESEKSDPCEDKQRSVRNTSPATEQRLPATKNQEMSIEHPEVESTLESSSATRHAAQYTSNIRSGKVVRNNPPPMDLFERPSLEALQEQVDLFDEERKRQERDMDTVTDEMKEEVIQLLELFGIPYVEAPAEAEAQCVALEELGLVDGIVTEDSDVFVFGGKSVYKNIFQDQKYVEVYLAKDAATELALGRNEFVALSMLLGGDYTSGVKGVGIVNGMEILQAFDVSRSCKDGLGKFRQWLDGFDPADIIRKSAKEELVPAKQAFQTKHRSARTRWTAPENFPADNVLKAYLDPVVDKSKDRFSWGAPDLEGLLLFCQRNMGWESNETEGMLLPVIRAVEKGSRQTRVESFFMSYNDDIKFAKVKSKRLREVLQTIKVGNSEEKSTSESTEAEQSIVHSNRGEGSCGDPTSTLKADPDHPNKRKRLPAKIKR